MTETHSLVLDVGTTGVKAFVFDKDLNIVAKSYQRLKKTTLKRGWVEQNPKELVTKSRAVLDKVVKEARAPLISFSGLGITNQRETTILWDKKTGNPVYPAIVWEDNRTSRQCKKINSEDGKFVRSKTGLEVNPYFSATKIAWILDSIPRAKNLLTKDRLLFGTVDTWILWNLTQEKTHATDHTNASRTLLFDIKKLSWDEKLAEVFNVPTKILPEVRPSRAKFGHLHSNIVGTPLPVTAVCGDQQSSMYAAGTKSGSTKITYGTGTFMMQVVGQRFHIKEPFFTTLIPSKPRPAYALEAKIDCCAKKVDSLLSRNRSLNPTIRSLAQKVAGYVKQFPIKPKEVTVDGGLTQAPDLPTIQAQHLGVPVVRQSVFDGTALGVAKLMQ